MNLTAQLNWNSGMHFTGKSGQHQISLDATPEHGGENLGPTPKELLLHAMMGCTAMDVMSMLQKMKQVVKSFDMVSNAEKNKHYPIHFKLVQLQYFLKGDILPEKIIKAVDSSLTKYCGVNYMISKTAKIQFEIFLNDQIIHQGVASFVDPIAD